MSGLNILLYHSLLCFMFIVFFGCFTTWTCLPDGQRWRYGGRIVVLVPQESCLCTFPHNGKCATKVSHHWNRASIKVEFQAKFKNTTTPPPPKKEKTAYQKKNKKTTRGSQPCSAESVQFPTCCNVQSCRTFCLTRCMPDPPHCKSAQREKKNFSSFRVRPWRQRKSL